ncbi:MAG: nuclear transport factor 2 family protein [Bacteroidetes bacterium]|nr:nuclear transport factor 2 family protein [Bacteroidota bacterium]
MKKLIAIFGVILFTSFLISSCGPKKTDEQNAASATTLNDTKFKTEQELHAANDSLYAALNAMFTGKLEPMNNLWSHTDNVTDMGPFGGRLTGWEAVGAEFNKEAGMRLGGKIVCKELHIYAGTDMGYTVCVEEGENMSAKGKPVLVSHRATNIFHLENGKWKLVHHQTDLSPQLEKATSEAKKPS